jgi:decaprenylphospho-beta-D-ribofuranose 2-oxidase
MAWKSMELTGWGRNHHADCLVARPERLSQLRDAVAHVPEGRSLLACGLARSYGDVGLNDGGATVLMTRLDRVLAFDPDTGDIAVEPGISFRDLMDTFLPRGFLVPVTPGTAFATIGGAVANDVHGKNHDRAGSFGDHVQWIDLLLASGEIVRISPDHRPGLFAATIGGIGLTGVMVAVGFRMTRVASNAVQVRKRRIGGLDDYLAAFAGEASGATYSVGWIDALAQGAGLGRGILETAEPASESVAEPPERIRRVPVDFPNLALNPLSVRLFNQVYWRHIPVGGFEGVQPCSRFFYPLDAIADWNRIYGRRGFCQFQCVVPKAEGPVALRSLLETISASGAASFLAVLKTLGRPGRGLLSFPMEGYTLALDLPVRRGLNEVFAKLERITLDHGGRIYLAKDSLMSPGGFAAMYPDLPRFQAVLADVDPQHRFASDMARRLKIVEGV